MHIVYYTQERDKNFEDEFLRNRFWFILPTETLRTSFSPTVELFLIKGSRLFIIFDFQQLLLMTNFDQTHRYGDRTVTSHQCSHFTTCSLSHRHRADGNFEDEFLRNRWTFFNRRVAFVHNFWFPATFITDKFWSDPRLQRSHHHIAPVQLFYYMKFIAPSLHRRKLWGQVSPQPLNFF
jgi:hypothetical protein